MARSYLEEQKQKLQQQGQAAQQQYTGMQGVSTGTGQKLAQAQTAYQPGQQAQAAQQNLQTIQAQKPQSYTSKYGAALDNILQQIQNPGEFKYSFNGDELFKAYADMYSQQAKQASMNAMGQAAALTGGYGNSYAQAAGSQAYQQAILPLYDRGMELAQMAQDRYNAGRSDLYNQLSAVQGMENTEYGRYRDTVGDWQNDLDRAREDSRYERELDYQQYKDNLEYYTGLAELENRDWNTQQEREEAIRQYNQDFAEKQRQYNESLAEQKRETDLDEAYRQDTLGWQKETDARDYAERVRQANQDEAYRRDTLAWQQQTDQRDFDAQQYRADLDEAYRRQAFNEQVRQANQDEAYRQAQLAEQIRGTDLDEAYRQQAFNENVRQADLDEAYRQQAFNEQVRQADLDEQYRRDSLAQNQAQFDATSELDWASLAEKQREYDAGLSEDQRQYNQKMAASWVADILANGQIPSNELLVAAGLSLEDAQKLVAEIQASGGPGGPGPGDQDTVSEVALSLMPGYKGLGMEAGSDYESMANAAKDIMGEYEKGTAEYEAAAKLASLYSNASKAKDTIKANKGTNQSTNAGNATSTQADIYNSILAKTTKKEDAGTQMKWDEKLKKFVRVK